ncbi:hypothetical protein CEXT_443751 [Caerostris extrusa]|uniref:Uncharacterized protein n=1 Tax=Caerostris extrusa TaxID=172846 RepID=A0AAV4XXB3_CAEEX|nr:hypothetical protein CEXT_443751 [Caerostris extrusa]
MTLENNVPNQSTTAATRYPKLKHKHHFTVAASYVGHNWFICPYTFRQQQTRGTIERTRKKVSGQVERPRPEGDRKGGGTDGVIGGFARFELFVERTPFEEECLYWRNEFKLEFSDGKFACHLSMSEGIPLRRPSRNNPSSPLETDHQLFMGGRWGGSCTFQKVPLSSLNDRSRLLLARVCSRKKPSVTIKGGSLRGQYSRRWGWGPATNLHAVEKCPVFKTTEYILTQRDIYLNIHVQRMGPPWTLLLAERSTVETSQRRRQTPNLKAVTYLHGCISTMRLLLSRIPVMYMKVSRLSAPCVDVQIGHMTSAMVDQLIINQQSLYGANTVIFYKCLKNSFQKEFKAENVLICSSYVLVKNSFQYLLLLVDAKSYLHIHYWAYSFNKGRSHSAQYNHEKAYVATQDLCHSIFRLRSCTTPTYGFFFLSALSLEQQIHVVDQAICLLADCWDKTYFSFTSRVHTTRLKSLKDKELLANFSCSAKI